MSCQSVLRIGPTDDNVSATVLRNALIDFFSKKKNQESSSAAVAETDNDCKSSSSSSSMTTDYRFQVSNRYFTADILLKNVDELYSSPPATSSCNANECNDDNNDKTGHRRHLALKEDGIILVFDAARSNPDLPMSMAASFDSLDSVHDRAVAGNNNNSNAVSADAAAAISNEGGGGAGDLLRLCVGVSIGIMQESELRGKNSEQEYSRRILWCLDRGYEYVEADLSAEGMAKGHDVRDKDGFARIVEAISGTVWSSAVMGATKKKELEQSYATNKKKAQDNGSNAVEEEEEAEEESQYVPPDPSMLSKSLVSEESDAAREEKARQALLEQGGIKEPVEGEGYLLDADDDETAAAAVVGASEKVNVDPAKLRQQRIEEQKQEQNFARLEGALRQASSLRDMAMSGTMSDEERRKRAGDAAVMLMSLMGMDDGEDTDEDEQHGDGGQTSQEKSKPGEQVETN